MALVWLMMYFSICLMIIISICSMIIVSREYFEITFISRKKDCADRPFEIIYISISGQHNLWKQFLMLHGLRWYMTFICKWAEKFSYTKLFSSGEPRIFYWRKYCIFYYFRTPLFAQCLCPYTCVEIYFKKGDGLLCQILIILQC